MRRKAKETASPKNRVQFSVRMGKSLRRKIEKSAEENGQSMNEEAVRRLKESFMFGPAHITAEALKICMLMRLVERTAGKKMTDPETFEALRTAVAVVFGFSETTITALPLFPSKEADK